MLQISELNLINAEVILNQVEEVIRTQRKKISDGKQLRKNDQSKLNVLLTDLQLYLRRD